MEPCISPHFISHVLESWNITWRLDSLKMSRLNGLKRDFSLAIRLFSIWRKFADMAQWLYLLITIFSSLALATTLVTQLSKGTWDDFIESHEVVVAVCMLCRLTFLSRFLIRSSD
jgi:hypothetical protein